MGRARLPAPAVKSGVCTFEFCRSCTMCTNRVSSAEMRTPFSSATVWSVPPCDVLTTLVLYSL